MQTDWNLVLNVLLFVGVLLAIGRIIKGKRKYAKVNKPQAYQNQNDNKEDDDIIAVRKVANNEEKVTFQTESVLPDSSPHVNQNVLVDNVLMLFLLAKKDNKFSGFDLLHAVLSQGLRYGEGRIFHQYKNNSKGSIMYSLAAATHDGTFDLQTIGEYSVGGLCLFFEPCGNQTVDSERFQIMYKTAMALSEALDAQILDDERLPLSDNSITKYYNRILASGV